jgi:MFS transporter, DHA1 family, putative efflux transporter
MRITAPAKLAVAWLTMFLVGTELFVFSPLLPVLAADYHIAPALAGLSVTMFSLAYMVSAPLFGCLADRVGRRRVLIYSLLAFALANILTAAAVNLSSLLIVRLFAGAAAAGVSPSIYALVGSAAPAERRATWLALVVSGLLVSLAIGASAGGLAGALFGGPPVFLALAGLSLVLVWLNRWAWPRDRNPVAAGLRGEASGALSAAVLVRRLSPMVVWSTGLYGVYTYLGAGLAAVGFSSGQTAAAIAFYGCGAIIGVLVGGPVADRLGVKWTASASLAGLCACLLLLRLAFDAGRLVEPALGVSSAVAQLFFPAQQAGLANDFPHQRAAVLAWNNSALFLGISLGSLLGAEAVAAGSFDANLTISAGIALAGCIVNAILVPGRLPLRQERKCAR